MKAHTARNKIIALFSFSLFLALDVFIGSRGYLIAYSIMAITAIAILIKPLIREVYKHPLSILVLLLIPLAGTLYACYSLNLEFSLYQMARSQVWTILGVLSALAYQQKVTLMSSSSRTDLLTIASSFLVMIAIAGLIDFQLGTHLAPSQIRILDQPESSPRLYLVGIELAAAFLPVFAWRRMYLAMISCAAIIFMTGGKAALAILTLAIVFAISTTKGRNIAKIVILLAFSSAILLYANQINSRIETFLVDGDVRRLQQINDSLDLLTTDYITKSLGGGIGTAYSEGYNAHSSGFSANKDQSALLENSRFDIENGYMYILTRFGVIGSIAFIFLLGLGMGRYRIYFITYCLLSWLGGSPVGPSFFMLTLAFAFASTFTNGQQQKPLS